MLPDLDGFEVHQRLAADGDATPVLFLTARDATEDKVRGLTMGGDDYVTKPFSLEELVARARAILRRTRRPRSAEGSHAGLRRPRDGRGRPRGPARRPAPSTSRPPSSTSCGSCCANPRRVLSKAQILDHVWHYDFRGEANVVETYISYLRKKVDAADPA